MLKIVTVSMKIIYVKENKKDGLKIENETPEQRQKRHKQATNNALSGRYEKNKKKNNLNKNLDIDAENKKGDDSGMHHIYLKDYECNPEGFIERQKGFGFREYFEEDKMVKYVMTKEEAS